MHIRPGMPRIPSEYKQNKSEEGRKYEPLSSANASKSWGSTALRLAKQIIAYFSFSPKTTTSEVRAQATLLTNEDYRNAVATSIGNTSPTEFGTVERSKTFRAQVPMTPEEARQALHTEFKKVCDYVTPKRTEQPSGDNPDAVSSE